MTSMKPTMVKPRVEGSHRGGTCDCSPAPPYKMCPCLGVPAFGYHLVWMSAAFWQTQRVLDIIYPHSYGLKIGQHTYPNLAHIVGQNCTLSGSVEGHSADTNSKTM